MNKLNLYSHYNIHGDIEPGEVLQKSHSKTPVNPH